MNLTNLSLLLNKTIRMLYLKHCSVVLLSILLFTSCGDPAPESKVDVQTKLKPIEISEDDIFSGNKILAFLKNEEKFIKESNNLFLKGLNAFRNEKNLDSADYYLRQSILKEPTAKAYFELGNVYMDKKKYEKALISFGLAEQLNYEPFSKILYNKACLYSLQEETELAGKYLEYSLQAGYTNLDHINKDKDLEELRNTHYFKQAIKKGMRGMSDAENLFWMQFKKQFSKTQFPVALKANIDWEELEQLGTISYEYEKYISEMRDEEFSREVSKMFYHYLQPYETDNYVALVYIVRDEYMGELAPLTYRLATFTHDGKLIDKKEISGRTSLGVEIKEAKLYKGGVIEVSRYEPVYEKNTDEHGYYDNPIVKKNFIDKKTITISKTGKIVIGPAKKA